MIPLGASTDHRTGQQVSRKQPKALAATLACPFYLQDYNTSLPGLTGSSPGGLGRSVLNLMPGG